MLRLTFLLLVSSLISFAGTIPATQLQFFEKYCYNCHDEDTMKGDFNIEFTQFDWNSAEMRHKWESVYDAIESGGMPPKKKKQPSKEEKDAVLSWLDRGLMKYSSIGGGTFRRLNGREYELSIKHIFGLVKFKVEDGFPLDDSHFEFDTISSSLKMSPYHFEEYYKSAVRIAEFMTNSKDEEPLRKFINRYGWSKDKASLNEFLKKYLKAVFRRLPTRSEIAAYSKLHFKTLRSGKREVDGLHLIIRTSLLSPSFLFRENGSGNLSPFELASRLSYFLTSMPPDALLMTKASSGELNKPGVLKAEAERLLKTVKKNNFVNHFTSQWLDTERIMSLMPAPTLVKHFPSNFSRNRMRRTMIQEVVGTFTEILTLNRPVTDFIDPGFIYTSAFLAKYIYELPIEGNPIQGKVERFKIPRGTKDGGLLSMPAIMMTTANGIDTQPILRGVWMLENILGHRMPPPPKEVPALESDTSKAKNLKELVALHTEKASCARCHKVIDPIGFVFENRDAIGRWRTEYFKGRVFGDEEKKSAFSSYEIDASGVLPNGTQLKNVIDLKKYLIKNPEIFAGCLAEKLMTYATGRHLNYRERKILKELVAENISNRQGFKDLILSIVSSNIFTSR